MPRSPDQRSIHVAANAMRTGLVFIPIGRGTDPYSITPERAYVLVSRLTATADAACSSASGPGKQRRVMAAEKIYRFPVADCLRSVVTCEDAELSGRTVAGCPPDVRPDTGTP